MMKLLVYYIAGSIIIALTTIYSAYSYERYMDDVEIGDREFYGKGPCVVNVLTLTFFPSLIIIGGYVLIVQLINKAYEMF